MSDFDKIQSFLQTVAYEQKRCPCFGLERGQNPFITISRETGAGGRTLALAILKEMEKGKGSFYEGWQILDQEIFTKLMQEPGLKAAIQSLANKEYRSQLEDIFDELIAGESSQDAAIKKMFSIMRTFACVGKVIILGKGGACVTRDLPRGTHLRLVAPLSNRIQRIKQLLNLDEKQARMVVLEQDKGRRNLVQTYFFKNISDPLLYDMTLNTERIPADEMAQMVVSAVLRKHPTCH